MLTALLLVMAAVIPLAVYLTSTRTHRHERTAYRPTATPSPALSTSSSPDVAPSAPSAPQVKGLIPTRSPDLYAREVAKRLLSIDYSKSSRRSLEAMWRGELADELPIGVPHGTSVAEAQAAGLATVNRLLPPAAMWQSLAAERTVTSFRITAVTEPPSWTVAITMGKITDPSLIARTVYGVQTARAGSGKSVRSVSQPESIIVVMLCPPTTTSCQVEVLPPPT